MRMNWLMAFSFWLRAARHEYTTIKIPLLLLFLIICLAVSSFKKA
jgi:hypothetical protein